VLVDVASGQVLAAAEVGVENMGDLLLKPNAPSASLFKIVTTAALYERGGVEPKQRVCTRGGLRNIDASHLQPARGSGAVCAPFQEALAVSRNAVYAQLSTERLQRSDLLEVAEAFGFNRALPLDLVGQVGVLDVPFNDLDFARTAAGFENSKLSVFGATGLALAIASGGAPRAMHVAPDEAGADPDFKRIVAERTAARIRRSMELVVQSGTAHDAFVDELGHNYLGYIQVAGKTGTLKPNRHSPTSSWFIGFAPSQKPTIAIGLLLKISDQWHKKAATTARDLLRYYFARRGARNVSFPFELSPSARAEAPKSEPNASP
jgi:penicillin-binding protein A